MTNVEKFNDQSMGEEIANAISHGVGALFAIAGTAILIVYAYFVGDTIDIVSSSIYGFSLIILYLMSTLYHALTNKKAKKVFQVFDHSSIFILILGSYAPICLSLLRGKIGIVLFILNGVCATVGVILNSISVKKFHKFSLVLYLVMGWSVMFAIKPLLEKLSFAGLALLIIGGLFYSIGVVFYNAKKPRYMHSIWHLFVLAGSVAHYCFILFYVIPM